MPKFQIVPIEEIRTVSRKSEPRRKKLGELEKYASYINQLTDVKGGRLVCSPDENITTVQNNLRRAAEMAGKKIIIKRTGNIISFFLEKTRGERSLGSIRLGGIWKGIEIAEEDIRKTRRDLLKKLEKRW